MRSLSVSQLRVNSKANEIFEFTDYREFLRFHINRSIAKNPKLSLESFAQRFGLKSRGFLHNVLAGRKDFSLATVAKVSIALRLNKQESLYFENLLLYSKSKKQSEKEVYLLRLTQQASKQALVKASQSPLGFREVDYFLNWYYPVIRMMATMDSFREDSRWIAGRLGKKVSEKKVETALKRLEGWRYLERNSEGQLKAAEKYSFIDDTHANTALKAFIKEMLSQSQEALDLPREQRSFRQTTLTVEESKLKEANDLITEFTSKFTELMTESAAGSEAVGSENVYHLQVAFFPLTEDLKEK